MFAQRPNPGTAPGGNPGQNPQVMAMLMQAMQKKGFGKKRLGQKPPMPMPSKPGMGAVAMGGPTANLFGP